MSFRIIKLDIHFVYGITIFSSFYVSHAFNCGHAGSLALDEQNDELDNAKLTNVANYLLHMLRDISYLVPYLYGLERSKTDCASQRVMPYYYKEVCLILLHICQFTNYQ